MKLLFDAFQEKLMDIRLRDKLLREGRIGKKQIEEYLQSLPDEKIARDQESFKETSVPKI